MKNIHPEIFRLTDKIFDNNTISKTINKITYQDKSIPKDVSQTIESIQKQCWEIYKALEPLVHCGVVFDVWLTGGAVRDLLLKKHHQISDLDIMISFSAHSIGKTPSPEFFLNQSGINAKNEFSQLAWPTQEYEKPAFEHWSWIHKKSKSRFVHYLGDDYCRQTMFEMVYCLLAKNFEIIEKYGPKNMVLKRESELDIGEYVNNRLAGVIKLKKDTWKWNSDILITYNKPTSFLSVFDFGICKAGVELINSDYLIRNKDFFPQNERDFFEKMKFEKDFLTDIKNKKIIIKNFSGLEVNQLQRSLEKHLPKLLAKYPEYKIEINTASFKNIKDAINYPSLENEMKKTNFIHAWINQKTLKEKLPEKKEKEKVHKI